MADDWKDIPQDDWKDVNPSAPSPAAKPGFMEQARSFTQEHPYATAAASLIPGIGGLVGGLTDPTGEVGKGALKSAARTGYGLLEGAGPLGMVAHGIAERTGLGDKLRAHTQVNNPAQEVGGYGETAAEMALPIPGAKAQLSEKLLPRAAEHLYTKALKPPVRGGIEAAKDLVRTGIQERIPVTEKGLAKNLGNVEDINQQIGQHIGDSDVTVSPKSVARRIEQVRPTFQAQVNPEHDLSALNRAKGEYLAKHTTQAPFTKVAPGVEEEAGRLVPVGQGSTPILHDVPAQEAHAEKVGTYRQLAGKYGELGNAQIEGQKALARGIKEELGRQIPAINPLNAREGRLLDLQGPLERAVMRSGNADVVPIGGTHVSIAKKLLDNPGIKSHTALGLSRAGELPLNYRGVIPAAVRIRGEQQ